MDEAVSAADANRNFSSLLRSVRAGQSFVITSHGRPVARIIPAEEFEDAHAAGRAALLDRLAQQPATDIGPWTRDELYDDKT
jgi:prevent-host-death family protein